ncbi:MAG: class I SAM-dependent methyltransferase [Acidobacteriales bacterium]|nr:class I SAM-dependent methyltransferase [Terriglobales bacterium]
MTTSYDEVTYASTPKPQTQPDRLATLATLHSVIPAPMDRCRVLEIGCGDGSNLIPLAFREPGSRFTGIDLARTAIDRGREFSAALGLDNIEFIHTDVRDWDVAGREFDYIIVHGVYSWVPPAAREAILAICSSTLSPNGVAYISYNALPGCHFRSYVWDLVRFHTRAITDPRQKIEEARAIARQMMERLGDHPHQIAIKEECKNLIEADDWMVFHDDLAEVNTPLHLSEFVEAASRHGLEYLCDAEFGRDCLRAPFLATPDWLAELEYFDYSVGRRFRSSLLCRSGTTPDRDIQPSRLEGLLAASPVIPECEQADGAQKFILGEDKSLSTNHPFVKRVLCDLAARWPGCVPVASLTGQDDEVRDVSGMLLRLYAAKAVELSTRAPHLVDTVSDRPIASALGRLQLSRGGEVVTSQRHTSVHLTDELSRRLLMLLDGSRDRTALAAALVRPEDGGAAPSNPDQRIESTLDANLKMAVRLCLLVG